MRHNFLLKKLQIKHSTRKPGEQMHFSMLKEQHQQYKRSTLASFIQCICLFYISYKCRGKRNRKVGNKTIQALEKMIEERK